MSARSGAAESPRLLPDQNLGSALVSRIADVHPGSAHVRELGLQAADDDMIRLARRT